MMAEATRGANSPILVEKESGENGHPMMILAVMIILVVFIFVIFAIFALKRENNHHHHGNGIAEAVALGLASKAPHQQTHYKEGYDPYNYHMLHDNMRDNLREFGNLKYELVERTANSDAKSAQYFYQTQREIDRNHFDCYKATKESEEKVLLAIAESERRRVDDERAKEREERLLDRLAYRYSPRPSYPTVSQMAIEANNGAYGL